ncbi:MAG: exodeoxyribonuclease VII small subunit [Bdellovibrionales bacterium]|nr:exodeoxyribonuclease VII small subunit [Bdellovibrionales bacterium]
MAKAITLKDLLAAEDVQEKVADLPFEQGLALLEELVEKVESGSLPLDSAISAYERGVNVLNHLRALLEGAEKKLEQLQSGS